METESARLRRLLEDRLEECRDADVSERIEDLHGLERGLPADEASDRAALGTLSDDTRYRLARFLSAADGELCVCELSPLVAVSDSAVSHALSDLTEAGLVTRRKEGQWRHYDTTERADTLLGALDGTRGDR
ncbi:transcriptional regulator [Halobacteriales archaeon QH_6_68_27]|jgi:DNA-binding transcriptional ArsR family regulator|nr:MAG: transcriptional regulator [Halobacteriales archaeon QH_6_68_27]